MNKKIRDLIVFILIISCLFTVTSPVFAEAGMSEITDEEWKEIEEKLWSTPMGILLIIFSPIILLFGILILIVKICVDFFNSISMILNGFGTAYIIDIFKFLI